ncbi:GGDEF domain-containing protein [Gilvimarinus algae]|uniref:diguanylate cyclase n=1 Tax=Gilvimarinus algae TaxID=3058037 RepID=A0ABT8TAX4_9GAMM|nr:GGDEF domain-containing protein [Gilvimarinus sp. SDUM040014]MDO3381262.1 GGDEF domain-containing protein [Gilvimarinus sp. SDUM040014]
MIKTLREDFRLAMAILLSSCAILAIAPLAIVRALTGEWLLAALDTAIVLGMGLILYTTLRRGRSTAANLASAGFYTLAALGMTYLNPQPMIYWVYPVAVANFFVLSLRQAIAINVLIMLALTPLAGHFAQQLEFVDMLVSLALVCAFAGVFSWKTEDQRQQLENLAHIDPLTGIGNRRKLFSSLDSQKGKLQQSSNAAVLLMDIDHFKAINDQLGHEAGDNTLQTLTVLLQGRLRAGSDEVFRYGGEEFLILLNNTDLQGACNVAEHLRLTIEEQLEVTASFGCAAYQHGESWDEWIARADQALYEAKRAGRNCVRPAFNTTG